MVTIVLLNEAWMCAIPWETCLRSFFLNVFFLPFFSGAAGPPAAAGFAIVSQSLSLSRRLLLGCYCAFARTFASPGIGVSALSANWQIAAMAIPTVGADFDEPFNVHRNFLAQIAFHQTLGLDYLPDAVDLILAKVLNLLHRFNFRLIENAGGARIADSVDIGQRNINVLVARKIDACNACHVYPLSLIPGVACVWWFRRSPAPHPCGE